MGDSSSGSKVPPTHGTGKISRRQVLNTAVAASTVTLIPLVTTSCTTPIQPSGLVISAEARTILEAFVDRIIPADDNGPGALDAGVIIYINNSLANWNSSDTDMLVEGLFNLTRVARRRFDRDFALLTDANKDALLRDMEDGEIDGFPDAAQVFNRLHRLTLEGMFSDPYYGGNQGYIGWDLIGYPGAVMASSPAMQQMGGRLPPLHTSAYGSDYDGD
jgi:gluconate 2-dehydrogenase gamma chain